MTATIHQPLLVTSFSTTTAQPITIWCFGCLGTSVSYNFHSMTLDLTKTPSATDALLPLRSEERDEEYGRFSEPHIPRTTETRRRDWEEGDLEGGHRQHVLITMARCFWNSYTCLSLLAAVGLSLSMIFFKCLSAEVSVFQGLAVRSIFSSIVSVLLCQHWGISLFEPRKKRHLLIVRGIVGALCNTGLYASSALLPLSDAAFMSNSFPAMTAVFSWVLGIEQLGWMGWLGVLGTLLGNAFVAQPAFIFGGGKDWDTERLMGIFAAIGGNMCMAAVSILLRYIGKGVNSIVPSTYSHVGTLILSIPFLLCSIPEPMNAKHSLTVLILYAVVCFAGIVVQIVQSRAFQTGPPAKATTLMMSHTLMSGLVGVAFFSESISWLAGVGAVVIVNSTILVIVSASDCSAVEE